MAHGRRFIHCPPPVAPSAAYRFMPFDTPPISARVSSSTTETESAASASSTVGAKPTKKKGGPVTGKALEKIVGTVGRIIINTDGDGHIVSGGKSRTYSNRVGALIRDRVPMLWSDWGEVPQEVWFEVPEHLKDSWADVMHGGRYVGKLMKNKIAAYNAAQAAYVAEIHAIQQAQQQQMFQYMQDFIAAQLQGLPPPPMPLPKPPQPPQQPPEADINLNDLDFL
ncbi:hypothetical protein ACLB2K_029675 [Fragaria x ananassa]